MFNGVLLSQENNEIMPFAATWMDLEIIIWCKESQTEKQTLYHSYVEFPWFFYDPVYVGSLSSGSSPFSKSRLYIWKFLVHILLKPGLKYFERNLFGVWNECNCMAIWTMFGMPFLCKWNGNGPFPVLWPLLSFPNLLANWVQHFHNIIFQDLK